MRRVIDSSVAFKWVVPETDSDKALLLRDDFRNSLVELIAPDIFPIEIGHALTRAERQGRIPAGSAIPLLRDILNTLPLLQPALPFLLRAVEISSQMRVGAYDCLRDEATAHPFFTCLHDEPFGKVSPAHRSENAR